MAAIWISLADFSECWENEERWTLLIILWLKGTHVYKYELVLKILENKWTTFMFTGRSCEISPPQREKKVKSITIFKDKKDK